MQQTGEQSVSEVQTPYKDENQHYSKYLQRIKEMKEITTARPKEMRTELAGRTMLKELTEMLQFSRQLQIKEHARNIQTGVCEVICIIMGDNPEAIDLAINKSDIVRELMKLLRDDIPLDEIEVIHISALKSFCAFGRPEHRRELYKLGVQNSIIHFMKSDKPNITLFTSEALYKILSGEWFLMGNKCLHPYFDTFEEQGIIQILFEDGLKGSNCEGTIETSAECLSLLYQQRELPDYMKEKVITQLKKGLHSEDKADIQCSSRGLLCLAQNKGNVDMILADNFLSELEEVIKLSQFGSSDFDKLLQEYLNNLKNHFIKPEYSTQNDNDIDLETDSQLKPNLTPNSNYITVYEQKKEQEQEKEQQKQQKSKQLKEQLKEQEQEQKKEQEQKNEQKQEKEQEQEQKQEIQQELEKEYEQIKNRVLFANIPKNVIKNDLMKLAIQFGEVEKIQFQHSQDGNSCFAIVEFISIEAAEAAVNSPEDQRIINGIIIQIKYDQQQTQSHISKPTQSIYPSHNNYPLYSQNIQDITIIQSQQQDLHFISNQYPSQKLPSHLPAINTQIPTIVQKVKENEIENNDDDEFNTIWKKSDFKQIKKLGKGGFGEVWLIEEINTKQQMAWKKMDYNTEEERKIVDSEVKILRDQYQNCRKSSQSFVHIVKPLGFLINEKGDKAFLVMEYCPGGDLNSYIKDMISKGTEIAVEKFWEIIGQLISAIFQLHSHGIIHGDLKPSNVLLTNDFRIKLADFGSARELQEGKTSITLRAGTNLYLAPEIHTQGIQNLKKRQKFSVDIWACGIMLYELLAHVHPFTLGQTNISQQEFMRRVINDNPPELPLHYPESMRNLIKAMLVKNPDQRITAEQIMKVPEVNASLAKK